MNPRLPIPLTPGRLPGAHKGLLLDKFVPVKRAGARESYLEPLKTVAQISSVTGVYNLAFQRWRSAVQAEPLAVRIEAKVRGRLALGLGIESVTEIGCRLHHTYGVPVIPASGLKGALRAAMLAPEAAEAWKKRANFLFGSPESQGFARVLDAWWVPETGSGLAVDVVTAHHAAYYTGSADAAPTDFDDPVPNHFLAITGKFAFAVVAPNESWKPFIEKLLHQALEERGLGAKRSSGYGRFQPLQPW